MQGVEELGSELLAFADCGAGVDGAQLLVAGPGELDLAVRVAGQEPGGQPGVLLDGQVLDAVPQQSADLVQRVVAMAAPAELFLLHAAADLVDELGALTTWKASSTCTASDR